MIQTINQSLFLFLSLTPAYIPKKIAIKVGRIKANKILSSAKGDSNFISPERISDLPPGYQSYKIKDKTNMTKNTGNHR